MLGSNKNHFAVIGAGGKMGSGIMLVLLEALSMEALKVHGAVEGFSLTGMDVQSEALDGLKGYLEKQLARIAQKKKEKLQEFFPVMDEETFIAEFVNQAMGRVRYTTNLQDLADAELIFEAIVESVDVKTKVFSQLKQITEGKAYFLSNTSSIPIHILDEQATLDHKIIGFHFYNPPPVQKLVEVISSPQTDPELVEMANQLGKNLGKILVPSNDIAGFIGNGHFMRDLLFGLRMAEELNESYTDAESIWMVNIITQDFLIRPMGIFQLMDYVGLDVCQSILGIMRKYLDDPSLQHPMLDAMVEQSIRGGQFPDGSQKDGFLKYDGKKIVGVYTLKQKKYLLLSDEIDTYTRSELGPLPEHHKPWKEMLTNENKHLDLKNYFQALRNGENPGAKFAWRYLLNSRKIAEKLVEDGVARNSDDVNKVLMYGFYHLYGPVNDMTIP